MTDARASREAECQKLVRASSSQPSGGRDLPSLVIIRINSDNYSDYN